MKYLHHRLRGLLCAFSLLLAFPAQAEPDELNQLLQQREQQTDQLSEMMAEREAARKIRENQAQRNAAGNSISSAATPARSGSSAQSLSKNDVDQLLSNATALLGVAYRFGGTSPSTGMDCSGFMQYIFRKTFGINLPRTSAEQAKVGTPVARSDLQKGDLVFFRTSGNRISHVGMYVGNNRFIHAPRTGKTIEIVSLSNKYWNSKYATARRVKRHGADRFTK